MKPYKCHYCGKRFHKNEELEEHNQKTNICEICKESFQECRIISHIAEKHKSSPYQIKNSIHTEQRQKALDEFYDLTGKIPKNFDKLGLLSPTLKHTYTNPSIVTNTSTENSESEHPFNAELKSTSLKSISVTDETIKFASDSSCMEFSAEAKFPTVKTESRSKSSSTIETNENDLEKNRTEKTMDEDNKIQTVASEQQISNNNPSECLTDISKSENISSVAN